MYIQTEEDYQKALHYIDELQNRGMQNLCCDERAKLIEVIRAVESYQFMNDPVAMMAFGLELKS